MTRKRFQIHLSTAVVLMFVAGGMLWLNTTVFRGGLILTDGKLLKDRFIIDLNTFWGMGNLKTRGWPFRYHLEIADSFTNGRWWLWSMSFNIAVAVSLVLVVAALTEILIRRRETKQP